LFYPYVEREGAESTRRTEKILGSSWQTRIIGNLNLHGRLARYSGTETLRL